MPSDIAVSIRNLSKAYIIAHDQEKHVTLAETILSKLKNPLSRPRTETFWALNDVSFDIKKGEVVGIIGRNGAGKSTLLKVLSRITEPTKGEIELFGRVGSLLEVGTGFHPELTGRENVFLNGAILGMSKTEIRKQFDAIVDFAGVEKFLDTPVKRYSSGMYVRLAFAVAAHLNSEILIIDEVLAVGDAQFQRKCMGKMGEVAQTGRTVIFVSHNMAAVSHLCTSAIVLKNGTVAFDGPTEPAIGQYLSDNSSIASDLELRTDRLGSGLARVTKIDIQTRSGESVETVACGQSIEIVVRYKSARDLETAICSIQVATEQGQSVFLLHNRLTGQNFDRVPSTGAFVLSIDRLPLPPGNYGVHTSIIAGGDLLDSVEFAARLTVTDGKFFNTGEVPPMSHGLCLVDGRWRLDTLPPHQRI